MLGLKLNRVSKWGPYNGLSPLYECWLTIETSEWILVTFIENRTFCRQESPFDNCNCKMADILSRPQCVNLIHSGQYRSLSGVGCDKRYDAINHQASLSTCIQSCSLVYVRCIWAAHNKGSLCCHVRTHYLVIWRVIRITRNCDTLDLTSINWQISGTGWLQQELIFHRK